MIRHGKGVTYVEIVASLFILAIIIPMLINIFQFIDIELKKSEEILGLPYLGQAYIEEIKATSIDELVYLCSSKKVEYGNYFIKHHITPCWNSSTDVVYYIIKSTYEDYSIYIFEPDNICEDPYIVINAMKYDLDSHIDIRIDREYRGIVIYCTSDNLDRINVDQMEKNTIILDNNHRNKVLFKLTIDIFSDPQGEEHLLSMETLFEREI